MNFSDPNDFAGLMAATGNQVGGGLAARQGLAQAMPGITAHQGQENALQKLAMLRIAQGGQRQKTMQDFQNQMQQMGLDATQATPLDWAGAGISGLSALNGVMNKDEVNNQLGIKKKNIFQQIFG